MDTKFTFSQTYKYVASALILVGILAIGYGFIIQPQRAWANILLNNYYFLSLAIGATFFMALQHITQSGWSAMFKRIPEAMGAYIPIAGIIMLLLFFGLPSLYEWSQHNAAATDEVIKHKSPYLNIPFFYIRMVIYFSIWIFMTRLLRKLSLKEDMEGGLTSFEKSEKYSKIYIFLLAITFSLASFDWIMSIDVHWSSTLFALKLFLTAFYHGAAVIALIAILLHERGYYKQLNDSHLLDFSRYMFMLAIIWGYFFFAQFMLIWYGNIPEETIYFAREWGMGLKTLFYVNVALNWFIPFMMLLSRVMDRNIRIVKLVCIILVVGQWIDIYIQVFPGTVGKPLFGFVEIGSFLGFAGLFALVVGISLSKASLIPINHPYLEESLNHHVE